MHLICTLNENQNLKSPEQVNKLMSTEIPSPEDNEKLHNLVMKHKQVQL